MKDERYYIVIDDKERSTIINALNTLRTKQIREERPTEPVDDLILIFAQARTKKFKVVYEEIDKER